MHHVFPLMSRHFNVGQLCALLAEVSTEALDHDNPFHVEYAICVGFTRSLYSQAAMQNEGEIHDTVGRVFLSSEFIKVKFIAVLQELPSQNEAFISYLLLDISHCQTAMQKYGLVHEISVKLSLTALFVILIVSDHLASAE